MGKWHSRVCGRCRIPNFLLAGMDSGKGNMDNKVAWSTHSLFWYYPGVFLETENIGGLTQTLIGKSRGILHGYISSEVKSSEAKEETLSLDALARQHLLSQSLCIITVCNRKLASVVFIGYINDGCRNR